MDLTRMDLLVTVARCGSMAAAAEAKNYTTSAVSQQIRKLEREAGTALLERLPRGVRLTEAGAAVVRCAEAVEARVQGLEAELDALRHGTAGTVRLGVFPTFAASLLPRVILEFRRRAPDVQLVVRSSRQNPLRQMLDHRQIDLAVTWRYPWSGAEPGLTHRHLLHDDTVLVLPVEHPLARFGEVPLAELAAQEWIVRADHPAGEVVVRTFHPLGLSPRVAVAANDYQEMQAMVAAGLGLMLCARMATFPLRDDLVVRPVGGAAPVREISLSRVAGAPTTASVRTMEQVLHETAAAGLTAL